MSTVPDISQENVSSWFGSLADEALDRNTRSACTWSKYKDDLQQTKKILSWLPNKLKHDVMVPIGPKALMRGKIVHTNELLVNLGETWFVKTTANKTIEICDRRIGKCDEMLDKLKKEEELLQSKKSLPAEKEAFGSEERPEIVEHVSEEEHQEWKKRHREKEKEYRKKLAEMRNKEKKPIETEEDLWNMLDELELREELEDELCRLNAEEGDTDDEDDDDSNVSGSIEESNEISQDDNDEKNEECLYSNNTNKTEKVNKRKVSFIDVDTTDDEPLILQIKHSEVKPSEHVYNDFINSPSDIYDAYVKTLTPKSILKNSVNINKEKELSCIKNDSEDEVVDIPIFSGLALPDVVSKEYLVNEKVDVSHEVTSVKEPARRISKFKASRMKKS